MTELEELIKAYNTYRYITCSRNHFRGSGTVFREHAKNGGLKPKPKFRIKRKIERNGRSWKYCQSQKKMS